MSVIALENHNGIVLALHARIRALEKELESLHRTAAAEINRLESENERLSMALKALKEVQ